MTTEATDPPAWIYVIEAATDKLLAIADRRGLDPANRRARIFEALELALSDADDDPWYGPGGATPPGVFRAAFWEAISEHGEESMPAKWDEDAAVADEIRGIVARRVDRAGGMPAHVVEAFDRFFPGAIERPGPAFKG